MSSSDTPAPPRERQTLNGAILASGVDQAIQFVLPLFAGAVLGLPPWQTGMLVAANALATFMIRPFAGVVVDRADRGVIAGAGAGVFAVGCGLYALATGLPLALIAATVTGVAEAFLWVAIRAIIGERLPEDSGVFAKLVAAEETGGWVIMVPAIILLSAAGYQWMFTGVAACCLAAALEFLSLPRRDVPDDALAGAELSGTSLRGLGARLRPMLAAVMVTMTAETTISLLLILHLQRRFHLGAVQVAYVFLPGAVAMSFLPPHLHRLVVRFGRRRMLMLGSVASALFAVGLAFAPSPPWIAALWVLSAVTWSCVIPVEQSVIAEAAGSTHLGRGLGLYEAACLAGATIGSLAAGFLYESGSWLLACAACAVIIFFAACFVPAGVKRPGVADHPAPPSDDLFGPTSPTRR